MNRPVALIVCLVLIIAATASWLAANGGGTPPAPGDLPDDPMTSTACILPPDYDTFAPPAEVGATYTDPVFGTVVTRVTVALEDRRTAAEVTNSEPCYFNADGSLFIAGDEWGKGCLYDGRTGAVVQQLEGREFRPWNVRWSADPDYMYQYVGNELRRVNARDLTHEVVHAFDEYTEIGPAGGEGDVDDACRYWLLDGNGTEMFVYDFEENEKGPVSPFPVDFKAIDYATVTSSGEYVVVLWRARSLERYNGIELYDRDWNFQRQLVPWCTHIEFGFDENGDEILVTAADYGFPEFTSAAGVNPGDIISVRLSDGHIRRLLTMPKWCHAMYSSCNSPTTPGYVYVSFTDRGFDPTETWFPYYGEIIEIPTDGSEQIRRLLHHRSRELEGMSQKATQPDFCVNRQGDVIFFKSNQGQTKTDLYMFQVPPRQGPEAPAAAEPAEENAPEAEQ